ncbi:heme exporter protein CcmB [Pelagibius litoralis]|uniref:Heme exporter protein B n=1 Tax=Pelagibius litoralis TaxID=374515 RepID=A0A967F3B9_9PROT|nr:heme exporter protein CcmB [Pelagibius litoralis]NIA72229.1 heme exporter protein CcmB [Pelagibius litoralis]
MSGLVLIVGRDLRLALRQSADAWLAVLFFVLTGALFPFGIGPEPSLLKLIAPGVIWVVALLAVLLSLERLFLADYEDGSLEQLLLSPLPLELAILGKVLAHWLTTGLPLIAAAPLLAVLFNMDMAGLGVLLLAMLLGTPILSLIGAIGAALTLGARRGGVLIPLLVLPLYIPALIFGVGATDAALAGLSARPDLMLLAALLLVMLVITPLAGAAALRQALE